MADTAERLATAAGVVSPAALLATFVAGATLDPTYDWPTAPFSEIGVGPEPAATVFNAGLVLGGLLALPFAWRLWTGFHPALGALYGLVGVTFVVAGLFPIGSPLHEVAALIFVLGPLVPLAAGVVDWRAGRRRLSLAQDLLALVAVAVWLPYDLGLESAQVGYGGAELVAILVLGTWSVLTVTRLRDADLRDDGHRSAAGV